MGLPVLDKESYQYLSSEYVLQAGQALKEAGYLHTEPTGTYDEEFAVALEAFQADKNITEETQVGPITWAAMGIIEPQEDYAEPEQSHDAGHLSDDGHWQWSGAEWVAAAPLELPGAPNTSQLSQDGQWAWNGTEWIPTGGPPKPGAPNTSQLSEDGKWAWNGTDWVPIGTTAKPAPATAADPGREVLTGNVRYIIYPDEVRSEGTVTWRARNPGAVRNGEPYGAYPGKKANTKKRGSFAIFPDEATGYEAIKRVLKGYANRTILGLMEKYAPYGDGDNDPVAYAEKLAKRLRVSIDTKVGSLSDAQIETLATAIKNHEGWVEGKYWRLDDEKLPDAVKKAIRGE